LKSTFGSGGKPTPGRLLTREDTVEFFNLMLATQLSEQEKAGLVAFLRALWSCRAREQGLCS
jgi:hypothetical protein